MKTKILLCIAAACGATLSASAQPRIGISVRLGAPPPVIIQQEPPRPVVVEYQVAAPSPGPHHVYVRSHHRWVDGRWVRVQGGWVVPPRPDAVWVDGQWDASSRAWTEEHWEINRPVSYAAPSGPPPVPYPAHSLPQPSDRRDNYYGAGHSGEFYVTSAPPPMREERSSARPSRNHVWITGYWMASHGRHEWVAGRWEVPPHERSTWIAPRWEQRDHNFLYVQGYWR